MTKKLLCEGACSNYVNGCHGIVKRVRVKDKMLSPSHDWGLFNYCDEAIDEDIRRGLTVTIYREKK
jgi:hypothetical protein